jgi:DJ-1/PfpI family
MDLEGKRVAILVEDNYEALEVWYLNLRLHEAGAEVTIVGPQAHSYMSSYGLPVQAQVSADHVQLIKAHTPADLPAFCRMIIAALSASPPSTAANANQD